MITTPSFNNFRSKSKRFFLFFLISILVISFSAFPLFAQQNTLDSLNTLLKTATHDTTRLRLLVALSEVCEPTDILKYSKPAVELADKLLRNKSINNFTKIKNLKASALNNIGFIYSNQGQVQEALDYYGRSLKFREEIGNKQGIAISLNNIGGIYLHQKNYLLALSYTDSSLSLAKKLGYPENIRNAELTLAQIDSARGKPAGAYEHYKLYIVYRDSIKNKENEKAAIRQQTQYEFEKAMLVKEQEEKERSRALAVAVGRRNKLQYSVILIIVVALLSSLLLLGKIKVSHKIAEGIVFFVFLIFFEFILVLADPYIESVTGGAPGFKLLFNAIIAAAIYPVHAFFERWVKRRLGGE